MDTIVNEMRRAIAFYQEKYNEERIQVIVLSGGTARLPGMVPYLRAGDGHGSANGQSWVGITRDTRFNVLSAEGANFCVAVGLALRT